MTLTPGLRLFGSQGLEFDLKGFICSFCIDLAYVSLW
jgi:hypothetical protein